MMYCNYCPGYCCYRLQGSVLFVTAEDVNRMARYFKIPDGEVRKRYLDKHTFKVREDGSCIFMAPDRMVKRCTIHEARPSQCRRFPYGRPCPYLERKDLLAAIQPRIAESLKKAWQAAGRQTEQE